LGIIIFLRSSGYNHDIKRRGRRVNKPWIEKTSTEDLKNSEFGKMLFAMIATKGWLPLASILTFMEKL
jgi:hypothetical protein